jgi:hypothetical protein
MIEHERSYIFTHEGMLRFIKEHELALSSPVRIVDRYFNSEVRLRQESNLNGFLLTKKQGKKSDGYRLEEQHSIGYNAGQMMFDCAKLVVDKNRHRVEMPKQELTVVIDFIDAPMRLAVLEVEAISEVRYPLPLDVSRRLFGVDLKECPMSTWELFVRKIGVCGAPSSGKTETAKGISHILNTEHQANSFHVTEYATSFIQKYGRPPVFADQFLIFLSQQQREKDAETASIIISDCPTFLAYIYALHLLNESFSQTVALYMSKLYKRALFDVNGYSNLIFLKLQDYKDNRVRYQTPEQATEIERLIGVFLDQHHISYTSATYKDRDALIPELFYINE